MDENNFLSIEQRVNLYKRDKSINRVFYIILLFVVMIFLIRLYVFRNQINELNLIIENNKTKATFKDVLRYKNNMSKTINTYMDITSKLKGNKEFYDFDKLVIDDNVIKIENYLIDVTKATNFITYFEKNFKVLNLHMENSNDNKVNLSMELEVNNNEK